MAKYGIDAIDPYHLSMNILIERFCFVIGHANIRGSIIAEARDTISNRKLELAWQNVQVSGTKFLKATEMNHRIHNLSLKTKQDNLAGLEIADAIVTPIARNILNRKSRIDLDIINRKIWVNDLTGKINGHGLVILPK